MRQFSPSDSTRFTFPGSRITTLGLRCSSSSTCTRCGTLSARSLSVSCLIVNQRIPALREPRPGLHRDDVIQHRSLYSELDFLCSGLERSAPPGARGGVRVAREQLQLRRARREPGELDYESLHRAGGRRPLQLRLERRQQPFSRSEEHTSELQSRVDLVCRLLLEKTK